MFGFGKKGRQSQFGPEQCGLQTAKTHTKVRTHEVTSMVPDPNSKEYQEAINTHLGSYDLPAAYRKTNGPWIPSTETRQSTVIIGSISCRRMDKKGIEPVTAEERSREEVVSYLNKTVANLYCQTCPYRQTGNLDELSAAQYDLKVAQTEASVAEAEKFRQEALRELEAPHGMLPQLPTAHEA